MNIILVLLIAYGTFAPEKPGAMYQIIATPSGIVRLNTHTGAIEPCAATDAGIVCGVAK